jgi:hypothetical protein
MITMAERQSLKRDDLTVIIPALPRVVALVRSLPGESFLRAEAADALGTSPATLRRLAGKSAALGPSGTVTYGRLTVPVYDAATVERLHAHLAEHRSPRGRRRLWTDEERRARRAAHCAAGYRRRRAAVLRERGDHTGAARFLRDADGVAAALRTDYSARAAARCAGSAAVKRGQPT